MTTTTTTSSSSSLLPLLAILALSTVAVVVTGESYIPGRTHLLDMKDFGSTTNFLFRGNMPKTANGSFALDDLVTSFKNLTSAAHTTFPSSFTLIDVSFLVPLDPKESGDAKIEKDYFDANPNVGKLIQWPLLTADELGPCFWPSKERESKAKSGHWDADDAVSKIHDIRSMLMTAASDNVVVYIHCEAGVDRTGMMSGAYMMSYQNTTYATALATDDAIEPRKIATGAEHGMEWYALYLNYAIGLKTGYSC